MMLSNDHSRAITDAWEVLVLFLIPWGGGIPAGVLLAKKYAIHWPIIMALYFVSDVILACMFEPVLKVIIFFGGRISFFQRFAEAFRQAMKKTLAYYGTSSSFWALVVVALGTDPMTGRAAAVSAGYGFVGGWAVAITGDMIYFTILMVCTLWLSSVLGDGTGVMIVILLLMIVAPHMIRKLKRPSINLPKPPSQ